jgi:hypothetical protein
MDETYYRNYLKDIYEGTDPSVYKVDPLLFNLRNESGVIDILSLGDFFKNINGITYRVESPDGVKQRASASEEELEKFNFQTNTFVPPYDQNQAFKGAVDKEIVAVDLSRGSEKLDPTAMMSSITQVIDNLPTDMNSHETMDRFMRSIHQWSGKNYFYRVQQLIKKDTQDRATDKWNQAKYAFGNMSYSELLVLTDQSLATAGFDAIKMIVETHAQLKMKDNLDITSSTTYLDDLKLRFKGPFYYRLKNQMLETIQMPRRFTVEVTEDEQFSQYFKMLAVDVYIKTCYQVLVYDYIANMALIYAKLGDFVNARIAVLAKVMYTYYFVKAATKNYMDQPSLQANDSQPMGDRISTIYTIINNYLHVMNNDQISILSILSELHGKSNEVVDKNRNIQKLQENIRKNQLALRNVIYNVDEIKKKYATKKIEMSVMIVVLVSLIVSCSILIALKMNTIVLYVSGGIAMAILVYGIIKMIMGIIKNNK